MLMPLVHILTPAERGEPATQDAVRVMLRWMITERRLAQDDLKWEHVGRLDGRIILVDLGCVEPVGPERDAGQVMREAIAQLGLD